ncbi:MAG: HEAT repeat domain-containing protein [Planctomycetota bacterium]|nr:MAG: HEAT repeat domain-containing protein [Planctomycetota bacterium]
MRSPRRSRRKVFRPEETTWCVELLGERSGLFFYRYQRLRVERNGKRAWVREFSLRIDYDEDLRPTTKPRRLVRQRGRRLSPEEADAFWASLCALRLHRLADHQPCLDHVDPTALDPCRDAEGVPIAVLTGEEGPACLTLRAGRTGQGPQKRIVVERFRSPGPLRSTRKAPLASAVALIEPGLREAAAFNYRRSRPFLDTSAEFERLKRLNFLNLREFERRSLEALGALRDPAAVPFLTAELFAPDPQVRLQALEGLARIGYGPAASDVELVIDDEDPEVRERAREVLELLSDRV